MALKPLTRVVAGVDILGFAGLVLVAGSTLARGTGPISDRSVAPWLLPLCFLLSVAGELTAVKLRHGEETEELTLFEAVVVVDVLVLPPWQAVVVPVIALAVASALVRRAPVKAAFNLGTYALSTAVMVGTVTVLADRGGGFAMTTVIGLILGTLAFAAVNLVCLAQVLQVAADVAARDTMAETWRLSAVMAVGTAGIGAVAVAVGWNAPTLLPFTLLPAAALTYAYRAAAQESDERERSGRLLTLSQTLAARLDASDMVEKFLAQSRQTFRAASAMVLLGDTGQTVMVDDTRMAIRHATAAELSLLSCTGAQILDDPVTRGRMLLAPLEAEGQRLGVLALTDAGQGRKRSLTATDLSVLTPLASALGVALRGAAHLHRLVEESAKLKAVVDGSSDGILVLDGTGAVLVWNPAMELITGVSAELANGRPFGSLVDALDPHGNPVDPLAMAWNVLSVDVPALTLEMGLRRADGEQRWTRAAHAAVHDEDGLLIRDVVVVHDVTRERAVERMKADFIATVSHELRTPITPIKGYVELLRAKGEEFTPEKRAECLSIVSDRVAHLSRLVEDLLLASRVSSPGATVQLSRGELRGLVAKAVGDFAGDAARLTLTLTEDEVPVDCDPMRVVQVVSNLVANGLKYSAEGSPVTVALSITDGLACVAVTDVGRGIPADHLDRVFEKFHRVEDPFTMTTGGTGLGLYIARQLAEAMAGTLSVTSTFGAGSTFTFTVPVATGPAPESPNMPLPRRGAPPFMPRRR